LTVVLFFVGAARADVEKARQLYERARVQYNVGDYRAALAGFKAAYLEQPSPTLLFNIAQAQRQLGAFVDAEKSYKTYLRESPNLPPDQVAEVRRLIAAMEEADRNARARLPPPGVEPTQVPTQLSPKQATTEPAREAPPPVDQGRPMRIAGIVTAGVGAGLVVLGVVFAVLSKQAGDDAYYSSSGVYDYNADQRRVAYRNADIACFVVGGAAVVTGTTLWLLGRRARSTSGAAITPTVGAGGIGVVF
jgi:tetratricopeptide (TPR) repeat protein